MAVEYAKRHATELGTAAPLTPRPFRGWEGLLGRRRRALVMGVLNVTPDSFSDGGRWPGAAGAVAHGKRLFDEGADLLDVGGESSRPGAAAVSAAEELRRVLPVVRALAVRGVVSIDTTKAEVAAAALAAGAQIVNDVSGATADPAMLGVVARTRAGLILMHRKGTPRTMQRLARYRDLVGEVQSFLRARVAAACAAGVPRRALALDPGIGFAKTTRHNLRLLARLEEIGELGFPIVVGVSRKRFLGEVLGGVGVEERGEGTIAASLLAVAAGARVVRVHDVAAMVRALRVAEAVWGAGGS